MYNFFLLFLQYLLPYYHVQGIDTKSSVVETELRPLDFKMLQYDVVIYRIHQVENIPSFAPAIY